MQTALLRMVYLWFDDSDLSSWNQCFPRQYGNKYMVLTREYFLHVMLFLDDSAEIHMESESMWIQTMRCVQCRQWTAHPTSFHQKESTWTRFKWRLHRYLVISCLSSKSFRYWKKWNANIYFIFRQMFTVVKTVLKLKCYFYMLYIDGCQVNM